MTRLLLGTHEPSWLGRSPLPLFVSLTRADRLPVGRVHTPGWALDSGGFTQLSRGGWLEDPAAYLERVYAAADRVPGMVWAAPQDWMCEPSALAATGLSVLEHQHRTVNNYCRLAQLDTRRLIVPVLQGWAPGDHARCVELYRAAGVALEALALVGVGTICRRQDTAEIGAIIGELAGLALHGFGVKRGGLARYGAALVSADSLAWSYRAAMAHRHGEPAPGSSCWHRAAGTSCANCYAWAHEWHAATAHA